MVQRHANAAPAQKWVVLLDGKIIQRFIAANIQRAHGDRPGGKGFELVAIDLFLLRLAGKAVTNHKGNFGSIQSDTFGPAIQRTDGIRHQASVDPQGNAVVVRRFAGQVPGSLQPSAELIFLGQHLAVVVKQLLGRGGVNQPKVAINNQLLASQLVKRQIHHSHHRRHAQGTSQDRHMRIA